MFELRFLKSTKKTIIYLAAIMALALTFIVIFMAVYGDAYYTCCSDDLLQYFKIEEDFIIKIKTGNNSFYNFNNYLGASFFSDTYYVPLDIFTFITFILSFFMNFEIAFGITEVIKLFLGTLMFAYFLYLRKCSNKAIFITSLIYFVCGYNSVMMAFSAFFSLVFYYPFAAVCLEKYKKGNKLLLPLCAAMLLFYNFYLGACTMMFMGVWFILSYFLDNKLDDIKKQILKVNPDCKKVTLKAILIYLRNGFAQGLLCAGYMVVGILIACVILLPSISYFLKDTFPRTDNFYKWSFNAKAGYEGTSAIKMYVRIIGNLFTPTYSTDFYGFINDYITDHNSLYITIVGLIILLYVFKLKDRSSKVFKIVLILEVVCLMFPFVYMIFSLNGAPYTRWFGMLNMFNLLIVAHVITETNLDLKLLSIKSLITGILTIVCLVLVLNYYLQQIYGVNIIGFISGKERVVNERLEDMLLDVIMMLVAIGIIIALSVTSCNKIRSKFNLMPYVLTAELVIGFVWMFGPKTENYNTIYYSDRKTELNAFLDANLEVPYDGEFARTTIKSYIIDDYVHADNYSRTNLYLSDLRVFHSFYDYNANELARVFYDSSSESAETRNSKCVMNGYSLYAHQILGTRYVVVDSCGNYSFYLPSEYYDLINDDGQFAAYEAKYYSPFMIYNEQISKESFTIFTTHTMKQSFMLNYACLDGEPISDMPIKTNKITGERRTYYKSDNDLFDEETNMAGYDITPDSSLPNKGFMHFYFNGGNGARSVAFQEVVLEFSDGRRENAFSEYAFFDELPKRIWVYANGDYNSLSTSEQNLVVEYNSFTTYETYLERMQNYSNLSLKMDGSKLHLSYHRDNDEKNIVVVPVTYNECWKCENYETVKTYGGLLGIIIPEGSNDISLTLTFKPRYINGSALISVCGIIIYGLIMINYNRRFKEDEENYNYCSLL